MALQSVGDEFDVRRGVSGPTELPPTNVEFMTQTLQCPMASSQRPPPSPSELEASQASGRQGTTVIHPSVSISANQTSRVDRPATHRGHD
mmetsp:Transcript_35954/g.103319  ORF Transcript_35954/g.103319 Transcript_35954/m.103319 type:complete len:90 (+) Transcript_35954:1433-1702(+)